MAITSTVNKLTYNGNGTQTVFPFSFKIFEETDIQVILTQADGTEIPLALTTDYTVSAIRDDYTNGGNVTTTGSFSPPASGETLTLVRLMPLTQETDYTENDSFPAETHENALDKLTMIAQQLNEEITRNLVVPITDPTPGQLPNKATRASKFMAFDANGDPMVAEGTLQGLLEMRIRPYVIAADDSPTAWKQGASKVLGAVEDLAAALTSARGAGITRFILAPGTFLWTTLLTLDGATDFVLQGSGPQTVLDLNSPTASADNQVFMILLESTLTGKVRIGHFSVDATGCTNTGYNVVRFWRSNGSVAWTLESDIDQLWEDIEIDLSGSNFATSGKITEVVSNLSNLHNVRLYADGLTLGNAGAVFRGFRYCSDFFRVKVTLKNVTGSGAGALVPFDNIARAVGCLSYFSSMGSFTAITNHFQDGLDFSNCMVYSDGTHGSAFEEAFMGIERISTCRVVGAKSGGFSSCLYVSSCHAESVGDAAFSGCEHVSACYVKSSNIGFSNCKYVVGCGAFGGASHGFSSCEHVVGCLSTGNAGSGMTSCKQVQQCYSHTNTTNNYGAGGFQSYADQGANACANTAAGGYNR